MKVIAYERIKVKLKGIIFMISMYRQYAKVFKEYTAPETDNIKFIFTPKNEKEFEKYYHNNKLKNNRNNYEIEVENAYRFIINIGCIAFWGVIAHMLFSWFGALFEYSPERNIFMLIVVITVCIILGNVLGKCLSLKLFPSYALQQKQERFYDYVEMNCFPFYELQRNIRLGRVEKIEISPIFNSLNIWYRDEKNMRKKEEIIFPETWKYICVQKGTLDFTGVDKIINERASKLGMPEW